MPFGRLLCILIFASGFTIRADAVFDSQIKPFLSKYCYSCHGETKRNADLSLQDYQTGEAVFKNRPVWEKVLHNIQSRDMPPDGKLQPTDDERILITSWIQSEVFKADCDNPDPGRVTLRRLNRAEYNNTIRDLVGVNFRPADDFPVDDTGYGFDNVGDVLSLSPILFEKYMTAATKILDSVIVSDVKSKGPVERIKSENLKSYGNGSTSRRYGGFKLARTGDAFTSHLFPEKGKYVFRVFAYTDNKVEKVFPSMELRMNGVMLTNFIVTAKEGFAGSYEIEFSLNVGTNQISAVYAGNNVSSKGDSKSEKIDPNLIIERFEVIGPAAPSKKSETYQRIFTRQPTRNTKKEIAREIIVNFAKRAYRRPLTSEEAFRLMTFFNMADADGEKFDNSIKLALQAVLVSPHFLFRGELQNEPDNPNAIAKIDEYALASRLSYFLWSSMPDAELFAQAEQRTLRKNLKAQVKRMLKDPKSQAFVENFVGQWLQIRNVKNVAPDSKEFPDFDEQLRDSMQRETELFFADIMQNDRNIFDLLDANYTFVNERLARHYGISGIKGDQFQKVKWKQKERGGLLTQASVLTLTSNPTRTSPVKRGKWVLENILGTPPPPPPPDVPDLNEQKEALTGTLRQRMEQHRANPACASCHARMDPIGFGFENFDGIGKWRQKDGDFKIDSAGILVTGENFKGASDLKTILVKNKKNEFVRCLTEKMLTYALGRGLEYYDKCATEHIAAELQKKHYKFTTLIMGIVDSVPFQMRRGEASKTTQIISPKSSEQSSVAWLKP